MTGLGASPDECAWCGRPATERREVAPEQRTRDGEVLHRALTVPVCRAHREIFERAERITELRSKRALLRSRRAKLEPDAHAVIDREIVETEQQLAELGWVDLRPPRRGSADTGR